MSISSLTKYRNIWMGIAVCWVMLYHSGLSCQNEIVMLWKRLGYGGVDICIFASGLGCFTSLDRNSNILEFLKRRFLRIVPVWICFCPVWIVFRALNGGISITDALGNLFMVQYYTGHLPLFNWYIGAIWCFYLFAPLFFAIITKCDKKGKLGVLLLLTVLSIPFCGQQMGSFIGLATRIPLFYMGMCAGWAVTEEKTLSFSKSGIMLFLGILGMACLAILRIQMSGIEFESTGAAFYPFILFAPAFCLIISILMEFLKAHVKVLWKVICKTFGVFGDCSLEIYIVHILVFEWLGTIIFYESWKEWMTAILLVIPCVAVLHIASKQVRRWMSCR